MGYKDNVTLANAGARGSAFEQAGSSMNFFAEERTNRVLFGWTVPAPCTQAFNCRASYGFANGTFNFTDADHFALDVDMGTGHNNAHFVGLGHRASVTAAAAEPTVLLLSGVGLVGAAIVRRSRRAEG